VTNIMKKVVARLAMVATGLAALLLAGGANITRT
jgi:hypothetical protein